MNAVVDEVLNIAQTDNKVKYQLTFDDNTTKTAQIDLVTPITTQGTPLNKALFDSIQDDLDTRLLISDKATNQEVEAGTEDSHYVVPSTLEHKLNSLIEHDTKTRTGTSQDYTLIDLTNADYTRYIIRGVVSDYTGGSRATITLNGTTIYAVETVVTKIDTGTPTIEITDTSTISEQLTRDIAGSSHTPRTFEFTIDLLSNIFEFSISSITSVSSTTTRKMITGKGTFATLTDLTLTLQDTYNSVTCDYTIEKWR